MASSSCLHCGHPLAEAARFCAQCGTPTVLLQSELATATQPDLPPAAMTEPDLNDLASTIADGRSAQPVPPRPTPRGASTMIGYSIPGAPAGGARAPAPAPAPAPTPAPARAAPAPAAAPAASAQRPGDPPIASVKRTMVGVSVNDMLGPAPGSTPPPPMQPPQAAAAGPPGGGPGLKGTMLGVAIPGIAPLAASAPAPQRPGAQGTMMGVAVPGIAPTQGNPPPSAPPPGAVGSAGARVNPRRAVEIAPMPPPLVDEPEVGPPPQLVKKGVPLALVAGIVGSLVAAAGVTAFFLLRSAPLIAQPRLDAQGHEQLHLRCDSCKDGTVAELYDARATFQNKEADLALATPLKVGNNPLTIHIDRPNLGRDESVQVVVPVAFRIRADLGDLAAARPAITVRVEAVAGTDVRIDGKPVSLDATGEGAYAIDISAETEGPADETRLIDRLIPYAVTPKSGEVQSGKLTVRVGIAPLHVDAPAMHTVVEGATFRIAGRTIKGGAVTANGTALHMENDGTFAQPFDIPVGDLPVELRASAPQLAPRTARWVVKHVDHLADEAKARELTPQATYDAITSDLKAAIGKSTIVEGDVVEVRTTSAQTVAVLDDARGCSHAPCLVRVVYGGDTRFKHGDVLRAFGRVTRSVAYGSSTVPEVEADFVLLGHAPKH